jgi:hypothetical protein
VTAAEKIADQERRLEVAREFYRKNQAEIATLKKVLDEVASLCMNAEFKSSVDHPVIPVVLEVLDDAHRAVTFANKYRQWCKFVMEAAERSEYSHLLGDPTWEVVLSGIEADMASEGEPAPF